MEGECLNYVVIYFAFVQVIQLEESMVQLKEDLALERDEAVEEKERLRKAAVSLKTLKNTSARKHLDS